MFDHFNLLAPLYDRLIPAQNVDRLQELLKLPMSGRLLDVGGGTGRISSYLIPLVDELVLTDASAGMLNQAREKGSFQLSLAHAERLPFLSNSFDRVLVVDALHHFRDQRQAIADFVRVLKPGGRMVIEEPDLNHLRVKMIALAEKLALMRSHFYSPAAIKEMIISSGLSASIEYDDQITAWVVGDK